jgi:Ca2+-dependent lipid-binding protein
VTIYEAIDLEIRTPPRDVLPEDVSIGGVAGSVRQSLGMTNLPSSYVELLINDELTYRTRVKPSNPRPFWNCSIDRFVRDWRSCRVSVVVRNMRPRERDPILGVVTFEPADLIANVSQVCLTTFCPRYNDTY